ncbi:ABC transporter permease [Conexibacter stalactiti]|uniref:ABC transporter permease n=1 Tax=Conexibacter stalactiti TaxID=1940611 RepID=A0ABU4HZ61_9ACTN|nr:ABC transporter permease [Conexibacter stalactiti]MDW5598184.1 ABC transporter permease [Conexibacter stalactiti]MEC5038826.1 ABC transporter permease [Conexibacter stalactiti]
MSEQATAERPATRRRRAHAGAHVVERFGLLGAWALVALAFAIAEPAFRDVATAQIIFGSQSTLLIVSLAVVVVLLAGEFDMSVGAVVSVSATLLVYLDAEQGWPLLAALAAVLAIGLLVGSVNAFVVLRFGVPSIVVTLGMATLIAGISAGIAGTAPRGGVSQSLIDTISAQLFGLPVAFYLALAVGFALWFFVEQTPRGRHLVFAGRGHEVARLAGLRPDRYRAGALIAGSLLAALGGIVLVGLTGASSSDAGNSFLLPAFAAAFLGSTTIKPGQFNVWGSFVAVYFLVTGVTGLQLLGYTGWVEQVFYGGSLLIAVIVTRVVAQARARTAAKEAAA